MPTSAKDENQQPAPENNRLRNAVLVAVLLGLIMSLIMWNLAARATYDGHPTPPQLDSLIYFQYAKALAEGHPYQFMAGDPPSTGSTSHLYPAVLSVLYRLGARGDELVIDSFLLCAVCFIATLILAAYLAHRLYPPATMLSVLLCALSGQAVVTAFGHSDMTLFVPLSLGTIVAGLYGRTGWCALLLSLCVFCRPEGMSMAGLLFGSALLVLLVARRRTPWVRGLLWTGLCGVAASALVIFLNVHLTGTAQFYSVAGKGHFAQYPFWGAVHLAGKTQLNMLLTLFWGLGETTRSYYLLPILGPALLLGGLCTWKWKWNRENFWLGFMLVNVVIAVGMLALSGWQGFMFDRHLGWCFPVLYFLVSAGLFSFLAPRITAQAKWGMILLLVVFQLIGLFVILAQHVHRNITTASAIAFAKQVENLLPPHTRVGLSRRVGLAYYMPSMDIRGLSGIASPRYLARDPLHVMEKIKHNRDLQFDYWMGSPSETNTVWLSHILDRRVAQELTTTPYADALALYTIRGESLEHSLHPLKPSVVRQIRKMKLMAQLDVGYDTHEQEHKRQTHTRMPGIRFEPFATVVTAYPKPQLEVGNIIMGHDAFEVSARSGSPLRIVLRVMSKALVVLCDNNGIRRLQNYEIDSPLKLAVWVNGKPGVKAEPPITCGPGEFDEVIIDIPAPLIREENHITVHGDFIVLGYWFYQ